MFWKLNFQFNIFSSAVILIVSTMKRRICRYAKLFSFASESADSCWWRQSYHLSKSESYSDVIGNTSRMKGLNQVNAGSFEVGKRWQSEAMSEAMKPKNLRQVRFVVQSFGGSNVETGQGCCWPYLSPPDHCLLMAPSSRRRFHLTAGLLTRSSWSF